MTAEQAIDYIHSMTWNGKATGYEQAKILLEKLGNPEKKLKYVHIGGTNGKGSTAAMVASVLQKAGYKTGLYTSPYIHQLQEQIQINGKQIGDGDLVNVTERVRAAADRLPGGVSEFVLLCCIAFSYFEKEGCDIVVLEVGMGGAMDPTNVIECPEVAILTNIGLDHTNYLGSTLEEIAKTKAGILKPHGTAVFYRNIATVETILRDICEEKQVDFRFPDFESIVLKEHTLEGQVFDYKNRKDLFIPLLGRHQLCNAVVAISAIDVLIEKGWKIAEKHLLQGLQDVRWPGRFEVICRNPLFVVDGGHNPQCVAALEQCVKDYLPERRIIAIIGVLEDKNYEEMCREILPYIEKFVCITPLNTRKMDAAKLAEKLWKWGEDALACSSIREGVKTALQIAGEEDVILAFGSLHSICEIKHYMIEYKDSFRRI